ncbi:hypothetical protein DFH07DRAFT_1058752 [Mycena maculata]|uniref:Uncharacterized protein n=1 Tax=Mycena maculata TaxID=230809 RepID=A0AAD7JJ20_9AGAR|nr:hypothetical protein DFH07DRAFT_1058752 [Mycena maculata]
MDTASLLTSATTAETSLAEVARILKTITLIGDRRTKPIRALHEQLQTLQIQLEVSQGHLEELVQGLQGLAANESRLSAASHMKPDKPLKFEQVPNPVHKPKIMPPFLLNAFRNTHPANRPGLIYEATVDRLACAFVSFYLPPTHQFLVQPQHTFRALAPAEVIVMEEEWSRIVAIGDNSSIFFEVPLMFSPGASSTPRRDQGQGVEAASLVATPPVEGSLALPRSVGYDMLKRMVNMARDGLRRPDVSVIHQDVLDADSSVFAAMERPICMAENKLKNMSAAIRQLKEFAQAYGRDTSPRMRFFAFALGRKGLEVAMFRFSEDTTELVPILPVEGVVDEGVDEGAAWYSVCDPFVHATMCELATEVQTDVWGLRWAYEA